MILYTVLSDPREDNDIIVTTDNKKLAVDTVIDYLKDYNVGYRGYWSDDEDFYDKIDRFDSREDFILFYANLRNALDSPQFIRYELNSVTEPVH
jgi:hypothetical protein